MRDLVVSVLGSLLLLPLFFGYPGQPLVCSLDDTAPRAVWVTGIRPLADVHRAVATVEVNGVARVTFAPEMLRRQSVVVLPATVHAGDQVRIVWPPAGAFPCDNRLTAPHSPHHSR